MNKSKASRKRVSKKIEYLINEGKPSDQAVAIALSMEREGRLSDSGAYIPVGKKVSKRKIKTASAESVDTQPHIVHYIISDGNHEYVDEEYPGENEDPVAFAVRVVRQHEIKFKSKPLFIEKKNSVVINEDDGIDSPIPNVFILVNYSKDQIEDMRSKI